MPSNKKYANQFMFELARSFSNPSFTGHSLLVWPQPKYENSGR
ncbi:hypothetical protein SynA15127_02195 [Synechococcus sp. A15-127]|nr:hypothetical protein SynA15127_02195 [Synechococcus sp. A15-127]